MLLKIQPAALGNLVNRHRTLSLECKKFHSLQKRKTLVLSCFLSMEKDSCLYWHDFRWSWKLSMDLPEVELWVTTKHSPQLLGPRLPCLAPCCCLLQPRPSALHAHAGALQCLSESAGAAKNSQAANLGIPLLPSSQLLQIFPLLSSYDDLWGEK